MKTWQFVLGILCLIIATLLFFFMEGSRSLYSGVVFTVIGIIFITIGRRREAEEKQ